MSTISSLLLTPTQVVCEPCIVEFELLFSLHFNTRSPWLRLPCYYKVRQDLRSLSERKEPGKAIASTQFPCFLNGNYYDCSFLASKETILKESRTHVI